MGQDTGTLQTPKRKISVQQFRPRAQDFLTNLDSIPTQSFGMRQVEPIICGRLRQYVNQQLKMFHEIVLQDIKRLSNTLAISRSDKVTEATTEFKTANDKVYQDFATAGATFLTDINTNCVKLTSVPTLSTINQKIEELRATQLDTSIKLVAIPVKYEAAMQSNYVPVENIIGTN